MSYRFKDGPGPDMRPPMGDPKFDDRMMGGMDGDKMRDDMDDSGRGGPRPPFRGRRPSPGRDKPYGDRPRDRDRDRDFYGRDDMGPGMGRDRSPMRGGFDDRYPDRDRGDRDRFKRDDGPYPPRRDRDDMGRKDMGRPFMDEPYDKYGGGGGMDGRGGGRFDGPPGGRFDRPEEEFRNRPFSYPNFPPYKGYYKSPEMGMKINECEIIVINKLQRAYAENIESRLKNLGIQVDILFLKDEALLVQTIDDIARRGSLYAVVISPLNETHGSVTLNILYGNPQEHRNMPLDDALKLVARNFHDYMRRQREQMDRDRMERGFYAGSFPADREIQFLFRLLADGRQVSIGELETVIKYLTERCDKMKNAQGGGGDRGSGNAAGSGPGPVGGPMMPPDVASQPPKMKEDMDMAQKEHDLQNRIMNIMNQGPPPEVGGGGGGGPVGLNKPPMNMGGPPGMGSGDMMMGPRPNQSSLSPNMGGPHSGMMPGRGGERMNSGGPGQPMGGHNQHGMGLGKSGMQHNQQGIGQNLPGMGPGQGGMGQNCSGMGPGGMDDMPGPNQMGGAASGQPPSSSSSPYINFDNPSVKKALDSLMQSGPNLLKTISMSNSATVPSQQDMQSVSAGGGGGSGSGLLSPRGPAGGGMVDMGNVGMSQGGNSGMSSMQQGMGPPQNRNMMSHQGGGNMGPHGMGMRGGQNMGPGSMQGMNNRQGSPGFGGGYGGGPNMMGNRPPYMGGGGPGGNQGMGGGPRRF